MCQETPRVHPRKRENAKAPTNFGEQRGQDQNDKNTTLKTKKTNEQHGIYIDKFIPHLWISGREYFHRIRRSEKGFLDLEHLSPPLEPGNS